MQLTSRRPLGLALLLALTAAGLAGAQAPPGQTPLVQAVQNQAAGSPAAQPGVIQGQPGVNPAQPGLNPAQPGSQPVPPVQQGQPNQAVPQAQPMPQAQPNQPMPQVQPMPQAQPVPQGQAAPQAQPNQQVQPAQPAQPVQPAQQDPAGQVQPGTGGPMVYRVGSLTIITDGRPVSIRQSGPVTIITDPTPTVPVWPQGMYPMPGFPFPDPLNPGRSVSPFLPYGAPYGLPGMMPGLPSNPVPGATSGVWLPGGMPAEAMAVCQEVDRMVQSICQVYGL